MNIIQFDSIFNQKKHVKDNQKKFEIFFLTFNAINTLKNLISTQTKYYQQYFEILIKGKDNTDFQHTMILPY